MRRPRLPLRRAAASALLCAGTLARAMTLAEAVEAARIFDPQYRAAGFELDGARLNVPIARAGLLPSLQLSASTQDVTGSRSFPNAANQEVTTRVEYVAPQSALSARVPLFNYDALSRYRQAEVTTEAAEATFRSRGLDLVDRVTTAYLQALLAKTQLALARTELASVRSQLARAEQRRARGEGTRTEEAQASAALELARFRETDARDQFELSLVRLRRLTGQEPTSLFEVPADFRPGALQPASLQEWIDIAVDQNPQLQARRQTIEAARLGVQRNLGGHLPRVDLVASVGRSKNESLSNLNQTSALKSIGVQLSVPLYSGGGVNASVRQAEAEQARTEQEYRNEREQVELDVQRHYLAVTNGATRVDALQRAVAASRTALEGTSRALDAGLATNTDVLDAQTRLFAANRDLAQARYEWVASRMRLLTSAGTPLQQVVGQIDQVLSVKSDTTKPRMP